jgi:hypothetical protein
MLRKIGIRLYSEIAGKAVVWAYPRDDAPENEDSPLYEVPTYKMIATGTDERSRDMKREFEVIRFGVHQKTTKDTPSVVGLSKEQEYVIKKWLPHYAVHSAESEERGAWQVYNDFLVHDGPDDPLDKKEPFASIGCVEICGSKGFTQFNDFLISISGATAVSPEKKLIEIADNGIITMYFDAAIRPKLKPIK